MSVIAPVSTAKDATPVSTDRDMFAVPSVASTAAAADSSSVILPGASIHVCLHRNHFDAMPGTLPRHLANGMIPPPMMSLMAVPPGAAAALISTIATSQFWDESRVISVE